MGAKPFEPAFAQLPALVAKWRKRLDVELAQLIKIPSHLYRSRQAMSQIVSEKLLHLACSVPW